MISARLIAFFVVCFAFVLVLSTPTPNDVSLYKRSDSNAVLAILVTVKNDIAKTIPKIDAVVANGAVTDATIRPLITELITTAVTALKSFLGLQLPITMVPGASQDDLVTATLEIVTALARCAVGLVLVLPNLLVTLLWAVKAVLASLLGL